MGQVQPSSCHICTEQHALLTARELQEGLRPLHLHFEAIAECL